MTFYVDKGIRKCNCIINYHIRVTETSDPADRVKNDRFVILHVTEHAMIKAKEKYISSINKLDDKVVKLLVRRNLPNSPCY